MSLDQIKPDAAITFLTEAASYFSRRPDGGEDAAFWANAANAETCRRIAAFIARAEGAPAAEPVGWGIYNPDTKAWRANRLYSDESSALTIAGRQSDNYLTLEARPLYASPPQQPVAVSQEEWCRLIHEVLAGGDADELMHHPAQKSWDKPSWRRWEQWGELADAISLRLNGRAS